MDDKVIFSKTMFSAYKALSLLDDDETILSKKLSDKIKTKGIKNEEYVLKFMKENNFVIEFAVHQDGKKINYCRKNHFAKQICDYYDKIIYVFSLLSEIKNYRHKDPIIYIMNEINLHEKRNNIKIGILNIVFDNTYLFIFTQNELATQEQNFLKTEIIFWFREVFNKKIELIDSDFKKLNLDCYRTIIQYSLSSA